jgi:arsenite methyltransferase
VTGVVCERPGGLELTEQLLAAAALPAGADVLDVGCGAGATVAHLAGVHGLHATGLDASQERVAAARGARPELAFVAGRAESLPFASGSFDAVLFECVLSTLADPAAALTEAGRVLRSRGVALLSDVYVRSGRDASAGGPPSLGHRRAIEELLGGAGFSSRVWEDRPEVLGRYLWDLAGAAPAPAVSERRRPSSPPGRRLGYFICLARRLDAHEGSRT